MVKQCWNESKPSSCQRSELSRTPAYSNMSITDRLRWLCVRGSLSGYWLRCLWDFSLLPRVDRDSTIAEKERKQIITIHALLWVLSRFISFESATWDNKLVGGLDFIANSVLQVPFFLMSLMRYITPTLDQMYGTFLNPRRDWLSGLFKFIRFQVHGLFAMGRSDIRRKA